MVEYALQRTGCTPEETLAVGDRLYTDILCGVNAGVDTALVLSGEATLQDAVAFRPPPRFLFPSVKELAEAVSASRPGAMRLRCKPLCRPVRQKPVLDEPYKQKGVSRA